MLGFEGQPFAFLSEECDFHFLHDLRPIQHDLPMQHEQRRIESLRQEQFSLVSRLQPQVIQVDRAERLGRTFDAAKLSSDHTKPARSSPEID